MQVTYHHLSGELRLEAGQDGNTEHAHRHAQIFAPPDGFLEKEPRT